MKNPKRTLLIGFIVGLLFFGWWFKGFLYINWRFRLFSFDSWNFLFNELGAGWHFSSLGDWIFICSFFLSIPLYFVVWYWANRIRWRALLKKTLKPFQKLFKQKYIKNEESKQVKSSKSHVVKAPPIKSQRPVAMPSFGATMHTQALNKTSDFMMPMMSAPMANPTPVVSKPVTSSQPTSQWDNNFQQMADMPLSDIQLPQAENVVEDITSIISQAGYNILSGIEVNGKKADYVALAKGVLLWASFDDQPGDWLADEEAFNDEDPLWFSETDHRVSPVFTLLEQRKTLEQKIKMTGVDIKVKPVLIERKGNLINAEDMLKTWNDLGVDVCRTASGGPVILKTVTELCSQPVEALSESDTQKVIQVLS